MDLFSSVPSADAREGWRLSRVELYNWGTFDRAVWDFRLDGDTSLLTGDIGSGKSTIVDALLTLLIPQQKIAYNKAADSGAKERSVTSYTRGYYAKALGEDGLERPQMLRGADSYSVILAVFSDAYADETVTLAEVFWTRSGETRPAHFYVAAQRALSIRGDFADFGKNISDLKKRLKAARGISLYDHFTPYAERWADLFHIRQRHAMELFQQIVSMKKVNGITDFVRNNMLDDTEFAASVEEEIERLLKEFNDLKRIHESIEWDREKLSLLRPLAKTAETYRRKKAEQEETAAMQRALSAWIAGQDIRVRTEDNAAIDECIWESEQKLSSLEAEARHTAEAREGKQQELYANGGERIALAKRELAARKEKLAAAQGQRALYAEKAKRLALPLPETADEFTRNFHRAKASGEEETKTLAACYEERVAADGRQRELTSKIAETDAEISSLRARDTNIPYKLLDVRRRLAAGIGAPESEMPFAGEILEVKPEEAEWEGALERLLHELGVALLVPETLYERVTEWMEKNPLGLAFTYYRVEDRAFPAGTEPDERTAAGKLLIKEDSPFADWIRHELGRRFDHICCETLADFRRERFALTKEGQIKTDGRRHRKDDRTRLHDRRNFVLGFSSKEKLAAFVTERERLEKEKKEIEAALSALEAKKKAAEGRLAAAMRLAEFTDFSAVDTGAAAAAVREEEALLRELTQKSDVVRRLTAEIEALKQKEETLRDAIANGKAELTAERKELAESKEKIETDRAVLADCPEADRAAGFPLLDAQKKTVWGEKAVFTSKSADEKEKLFTRWLEKRLRALTEALMEGSQKLVGEMNAYLSKLRERGEEAPNLTAEVNATNLSEYEETLRQIEKDDLPRLLPKFRRRLREGTVRGMTIFASKLSQLHSRIASRIEEINGSLASIDYNPGHFIRIECTETANQEIKDFRRQLRAVTEKAMTGGDDLYNEARFKDIESILSRFDANRAGHTEADAKWTRRVTDVRNWVNFAISERVRREDGTDGGEYEHYTDSSGKSGGQKEKLAYTILAASFVYSFGLHETGKSFRFAMIDEAFLKSSDDSAQFGLTLFRQLDIQLLVVTPLAKIPAIEPFVGRVGYVSQNGRRSEIRNMTIREYREEKIRNSESGMRN